MTTITLDWDGVPDANPISAPTGFTSLGAGTANVAAEVWSGNSSSANTIWGCDTAPSGDTFTSSFVMGASNSNGRGISIYNSSGNGFMFLARSTDIRVFALAAYVLSGSALATYTISVAIDKVIEVDVTQSTGTYVVKYDGSTVNTFVNATYTSGLRTGPLSRSGGIKSFSLTYTDAQSVVSINGGNEIEVGETGIHAVLTGFTGAITSITTNQTGMTVSGITGTTNAPVFNPSGWVEAGPYPELPVSATFTFNYLAESASASETVTYPAGWVKQTFSGAIIDNDRYFGYIFDDAGHTVDGSVLYYDPAPIPGLVINPDTSWDPVAEGGTFDAWLRSPDGNMYYFELTIQEDGTATGRGITAVGLTMSGITMRGITAVGL